MLTRLRLTRFEAACAKRFSGEAPAPAWDRLYCELPFTLIAMAERNEPKAAYVLGDIFDQGMGGLEQDFEKALLYYRLAEKIEDPDALNNIGSMHYQGDALPLDREKARHYFERAVAGGCAAAMNNLGRMYLDGEGGAEVDIAKGLALLKRGAEAYDINAALKLKSIYYEGSYDQRKSQFEYVRWLWQAAFNGHAGSYAVIGDILAAGEIVKRQPRRVRPLYERALALSDGYGAFCLGLDYCSGKCGPQDVERGLQYLRQAAAMGEEDAAEIAEKIVQSMRTALEEDDGAMLEHIKTNRRGLFALGTALAAAVRHGWENLFGAARAEAFTGSRKGKRISPLFASADDLRAVVDEYCVRNVDTPLVPEQIKTLIAGLVPQLWIARRSGEGEIGATRFGGAPDLPNGTPWPLRKALPERAKAAAEGRNPKLWVVRQLAEEVPFEFVAQIDLAEVANYGAHAQGLPAAGRLLFFVDDAVLMDKPAAPADGCLVIHDATPRDGLERIAVPARFDEMEAWWRTRDPKDIARYEAMAKTLEAAGQADAAKAMQEAVRAESNPDTSARKPFVYPARAMKLVPLVVLPDKHAIEVEADAGLKSLAYDDVSGEHYSLLTSNDAGPFSSDPEEFRRTQPWLTLEARRNRLMGPPQPEQSDPRFDCIPQAEKPAYPWNEDQLVALTKKAAEWCLLLQVSVSDLSQAETEGTLYFMISIDDLARGDFSRCRVTYQQT